MKIANKRYFIVVLYIFFYTYIMAQTPISNRVKAAVKHLPTSATIIAKYTDNDKHCLYYTLQNKIYCLDVILNINEELDFTEHGHKKILSSHISPNSEYLLLCISKKDKQNPYELWRINAKEHSFSCLAKGSSITKTKEGYTLQKKNKQNKLYIIKLDLMGRREH